MKKFVENNNFVWQKITRDHNLKLSQKLKLRFDVQLLKDEVSHILIDYGVVEQHGPYHTGGWDGISLYSAYGDHKETRLVRNASYQKTIALKNAPYIESIIDSFNCEKRRIRLMGLTPNKNIFWHYDSSDSIDSETIRLHIPIITNPLVELQICHETHYWEPGELWYGDFSFPHRVYNGWDQTRIHLIIDLLKDKESLKIFDNEYVSEKKKRSRIRKEVYGHFKQYSKNLEEIKKLEGYVPKNMK